MPDSHPQLFFFAVQPAVHTVFLYLKARQRFQHAEQSALYFFDSGAKVFPGKCFLEPGTQVKAAAIPCTNNIMQFVRMRAIIQQYLPFIAGKQGGKRVIERIAVNIKTDRLAAGFIYKSGDLVYADVVFGMRDDKNFFLAIFYACYQFLSDRFSNGIVKIFLQHAPFALRVYFEENIIPVIMPYHIDGPECQSQAVHHN